MVNAHAKPSGLPKNCTREKMRVKQSAGPTRALDQEMSAVQRVSKQAQVHRTTRCTEY